MSESLALPGPVVPPSDVECEACERMATINVDGCEDKAAKVKERATLTFDKPEPIPPAPTFVVRQNTADRARIQAEIDALL